MKKSLKAKASTNLVGVKKQAKIAMAKALEEDPTVFQVALVGPHSFFSGILPKVLYPPENILIVNGFLSVIMNFCK